MPTVSEILTLFPISQYLASTDITKKGLNGGGTDVLLQQKIYNIGTSVQNRYNINPSDETLTDTANFLFSLMGKYGYIAQRVAGATGSVSGISQTGQYFPIYITELSFDTSTHYANTKISGNNVIIFLNEINRYLIPNTEFTVDVTGITITLGGFNSSLNTYNLVIEKIA
jgi:hypothetical protein